MKEFLVSLESFGEAVDFLEALGFGEHAPPDETHWNFSNKKTGAFAEVRPVEAVSGKCFGFIHFSLGEN